MLEVEGLTVSYGKHRALEGAGLRVGKGEIVVILGANGAGKTTLLKAICGVCEGQVAGRVRMDGVDIAGMPPHRIVGEGIALNEALCENLFMILVSLLNQIPIFVIGKPGSSKSLAMSKIQSNLNGEASDTPFLRSLPAVEVFSYQCSPLSTSSGIEQAFDAARRYRREVYSFRSLPLLAGFRRRSKILSESSNTHTHTHTRT